MFGMHWKAGLALACVASFAFPLSGRGQSPAAGQDSFDAACRRAGETRDPRVVCADLVALDQMLVYNRFGSFNPYGMIFALRRNVVAMGTGGGPVDCAADTATQADPRALAAGRVRLRDCQRPRPLVLRANVGDLLFLRVTNLLAPSASHDVPADDPSRALARELSRDFCPRGEPPVAGLVSQGSASMLGHGEALCEDAAVTAEDLQQGGQADPVAPEAGLGAADWPRTRSLNLVAEGLMPLAMPGQDGPAAVCLGLDAVAPGRTFECLYEVVQEGTHFFASRAAPAGGEGDGGSITHGLFGAVLAERPGTRWYRSQVSAAVMDAVWTPKDRPRHARDGAPDYERLRNGVPLLNMARALDGGAFRDAKALELVHADLNAIIWCDAQPGYADRSAPAAGARPLRCSDAAATGATGEPRYDAFREFSVFFHDELKSFYTRNFEELARFGQLAGVRDGFAINYGASGMGTMLLANRKGIGPAAACAECLYEEFFLTSWANGDPALLEWYPDDPSNVHHSYLNDPVVFRNFHAGPKETHVFHLHAHQWFAGNDPGRGSYLDSQTVAPAQGFTYNIYHGGRTRAEGGWYVGGSGNRNRTVGDSIFHCHLYPHFAQGMWALWRVHDVFEDGSRKLPDGQAEPGISAAIRDPLAEARRYFQPKDPANLTEEEKQYLQRGDFFARTGSVDPRTGAWLATDDPATRGRIEGAGTPIPALVPLPGEALPPLPSYGPSGPRADADRPRGPRPATAALPRRGASLAARRTLAGGPERVIRAQATTPAAPVPVPDAMPGYPFYIAGTAGHRPPQAPGDIARALNGDQPTDELLSGALGRHVVLQATRRLPFDLPAGKAAHEAELARTLDRPGHEQRLESLRGQIVAKALARGDMTAQMADVRIRMLDPDGEPLERAAQAFHHDGAGLTVRTPDGTPVPALDGSYAMPRAPLPGATAMPAGKYQVNGAPPAPGAPFADPCGGARNREGTGQGTDPLTGRAGYVVDPGLMGFRRYEVSAVQLDLVVNKAGWHDPQARIDVLTQGFGAYGGSDQFKLDGDSGARISPTTRDDAEPFFFRAQSGECIEFRHTNELPKDLELDDFQVRTPTDTIGQHIHLVKFDVTASDGSGNGWNYEDGTFAADETATRLCHWAETGDPEALAIAARLGRLAHDAAQPRPDSDPPLSDLRDLFASADFCAARAVGESRIWRLPRGRFPFLFQTTVQRWFADPILTQDGAATPEARDRTLRTVFSHDHFGPSSIQQHGFYTALVIEPGTVLQDGQVLFQAEVCSPHEAESCSEPVPDDLSHDRYALHQGDDRWVGAHKIVRYGGSDDPFHPDYREFALAVADFALLYDPRDREDVSAIEPAAGAERSGMARLYCEAKLAQAGTGGAAIAGQCGAPALAEPDIAPAYWAAGLPGDRPAHRARLHGSLLEGDHEVLREHLLRYRSRAASPDGKPVAPLLARAVAPPARPEAISVDHHDPYLVNYRGAPLPLRLAGKIRDGSASADCAPRAMTQAGHRPLTNGPSAVVESLMQGAMPVCSYSYQLAGAAGDAGDVLRSWLPGRSDWPRREPETPLFEAYQDERLLFRLVQGAQEVQHVFNIAGLAAPRNIDQRFPQGMRDLAVTVPPARQACFGFMRKTHPEEYEAWLRRTPQDGPLSDYQVRLEQALARCDNLEGYTAAQEIGISEHFEIRGRMRADTPTMEFDDRPTTPVAPAGAAPGDDPGKGLGAASDYLYNFGTVDSLWNGAWGLLRVYPDVATRDALLAKWRDHPAPATLLPVAPAGGAVTESVAAELAGTDAFGPGATCPLPSGDMLAADARSPGPRLVGRNVAALVVALRTADVWGETGTDYGGQRHDPDGLMLALLSPQDLRRDITVRRDWESLPRQTVLDAVRAAYARPEPLVLRVNAGDCVTLRYVNLLVADRNGGLPDALGDALMPPIAPLNVDPVPEVEGRDGATVRAKLQRGVPDGPEGGLRPSARLALSVGLPGGDLIRNQPLGFGINAPAMRPATATTAEVSELMQFYAGRLRIGLAGQQDFDDLANRVIAVMAQRLRDWGIDNPRHTQQNIGQPAHFNLLGRNYWADEDAVLDRDRIALMNTAAQAELQKQFHWIPYAFGPVPVRVTGDVVSQPVHGLFGVIDVLPQGWNIPDALQPAMARPRGDSDRLARLKALGLDSDLAPPEWRAAAVVPARSRDGSADFGAPARYRGVTLDPHAPPGTGQADIREFVIFYQDGLNHHDRGSKIAWTMDGTARREKLTPDCMICDDSYDHGEQGVSYRSRPFASLLRYADIGGNGRIEASDDLNAILFPDRFLAGKSTHGSGRPTDAERQPLTLAACPGEQVLIRIVHPGGRARQRAFVMNGLGYDDLFPGFGFPNAALVAPGKTVSAWLHPPGLLGTAGSGREPVEGTVLWHDGPSFLTAGGTWGLLEFAAKHCAG